MTLSGGANRVTLCERIAVVCTEVEHTLPEGAARSKLRTVRERLSEPGLRMAVGGRLNAGKSTLVNALLGQRLAATDRTECTRIVTWFRYHHQNRVEVRPSEGKPYRLPAAPGGGVPSGLRLPADRIDSVVVEASNTALAAGWIVVDTPGLDALSGLDEVSLAALAEADALLYVMPHPGQLERESLEALRLRSGPARLTAQNVVGVLSQVDLLGDAEEDPWPLAERVRRRYLAELRPLMAAVVPVAGLLAETSLGDRFTEADMRLLHTLREAAIDNPRLLDGPLYSSDEFLAWDSGVLTRQDRERLVSLLDRYGIRLAIELIDQGAISAVRLLAELRRRSGIDVLLGEVRSRFLAVSDALRAAGALAALEDAAWRGTDVAERQALQGMQARLDALRQDPRLRHLELSSALSELASGRLTLPPELEAELVRLASGATPAACLGLSADVPRDELASAADACAQRWRALEAAPTRALSRQARTVREVCEAWYFDAVADGASG